MSKDKTTLMPLIVKLRLELTDQQKQEYLELMKLYAQLCNEHVQKAIEYNVFNQCGLYKYTYDVLRKSHSNITSSLFTSARMSVCNTFKGLHRRQKQVTNRVKWFTSRNKTVSHKLQKQHDKIMSVIPYFKDTSSISLSYGISYDIHQSNREMSIISLHKRLHVIYTACKRDVERLKTSQIFGDAHLVYNKNNDMFYLYVPVYVQKKQYIDNNTMLGVDQGIENILTGSDGFNIKGENTWNHLKKIMTTRSRYQKVADDNGNRHATRKHAKKHLKQSSGRQMRYINNQCHMFSKQLIQHCLDKGYSDIALEDLRGIKSKVKFRIKSLRKILHKWPQAKLIKHILYKAELNGIKVTLVPPYHTSVTCYKCHSVYPNGRVTRSTFVCPKCGMVDADINAARNMIPLAYLLKKKNENKSKQIIA